MIAVSSVRNQDTLHALAIILDAMSVMNMVTLSWTVHTEYLLQESQWLTTNLMEVTMSDSVWGTTVMIETGKADTDHSLAFEDIIAWVIITPIEVTLDHNVRTDAATTGAAHNNLPQSTKATATTIYLTVTHHINHFAVLHNIKALWVIDPEIALGHIHGHPIDLQGTHHEDQVHNPAGQK